MHSLRNCIAAIVYHFFAKIVGTTKKVYATLWSMMNAKPSQQLFWHFHENLIDFKADFNLMRIKAYPWFIIIHRKMKLTFRLWDIVEIIGISLFSFKTFAV